MAKKLVREVGKTYVYLIRHAHWIPPTGSHRFNPNIPLSEKGKHEAKALAKKFCPLKECIDIFFCSSLGRAKETAMAVSKIIRKKPIQSDELWEFSKIIWTRKYYRPKYWMNFMKYRRVVKGFNKILQQNKGKVILIVAHGNVIKGILRNKQKLSIRKLKALDYKNCHITLLKFNGLELEKSYCINTKNPPLIRQNR